MFASPNIRIFSQQNQENAGTLMAKKAGSINSSQRKPLADRSNNRINQNNSLKPQELKQKSYSGCKSPKTKVEEPEEFECLFDEIVYKEFDDNFEDIWAKEDRLSESDINSIVKAFAEKYRSETPSLLEEPFKAAYVFEELPINDSGIAEYDDEFDISLIEDNDVSVPDFSIDDIE
ncbi:uncharacterized protein LOC108744531 [Agrilus planipennis]|uniref:Uncharacterized protein LOC108744531 n=1 Tax=Agrilus planipennis TaxID=224129 RepID=A0A1W4XIP7_AGRPL|nr:uncharacterized protein LOC108744531 [Agrilus planipennis]